ncbi:TetR/AcrR family transcriptional regulator [Bacillus sp. ISL-51]|uniref:TetR/AcrR family transcriptional regulator n=1 Tax=Bacteria TaxID=2 RepID=UPI001BEC7C77|nr:MULTISPECIES: TetR/AcrR family transcriptional regulator [Bacteria]MBT2573107.1 TetR/AcrR family transcriptional regulator [Bacillus sp. ISL-51]MBT2635010.1 TetR/AcrR family transcriptional regulator [Bacillus sp. ISL-26]MBT2712074.1 TetR/AcrR family transcriptional regulator [Pseudomonas sp. ISL-88]
MARTGRPRAFDKEEAISKAMVLYWEQGFESTSLAQLKEVMGISSASFYAAFGSKEALFKEVIDRYKSSYGQVTDCLTDTSITAKEAIEKALRQSAKMQTDSDHPSGCLLVLSASVCSDKNNHVRDLLSYERSLIRSKLETCIRRGQEEGEISDSADAAALCAMFEAFMYGISTQAKDGVSHSKIDLAVTQIMKAIEI